MSPKTIEEVLTRDQLGRLQTICFNELVNRRTTSQASDVCNRIFSNFTLSFDTLSDIRSRMKNVLLEEMESEVIVNTLIDELFESYEKAENNKSTTSPSTTTTTTIPPIVLDISKVDRVYSEFEIHCFWLNCRDLLRDTCISADYYSTILESLKGIEMAQDSALRLRLENALSNTFSSGQQFHAMHFADVVLLGDNPLHPTPIPFTNEKFTACNLIALRNACMKNMRTYGLSEIDLKIVADDQAFNYNQYGNLTYTNELRGRVYEVMLSLFSIGDLYRRERAMSFVDPLFGKDEHQPPSTTSGTILSTSTTTATPIVTNESTTSQEKLLDVVDLNELYLRCADLLEEFQIPEVYRQLVLNVFKVCDIPIKKSSICSEMRNLLERMPINQSKFSIDVTYMFMLELFMPIEKAHNDIVVRPYTEPYVRALSNAVLRYRCAQVMKEYGFSQHQINDTLKSVFTFRMKDGQRPTTKQLRTELHVFLITKLPYLNLSRNQGVWITEQLFGKDETLIPTTSTITPDRQTPPRFISLNLGDSKQFMLRVIHVFVGNHTTVIHKDDWMKLVFEQGFYPDIERAFEQVLQEWKQTDGWPYLRIGQWKKVIVDMKAEFINKFGVCATDAHAIATHFYQCCLKRIHAQEIALSEQSAPTTTIADDEGVNSQAVVTKMDEQQQAPSTQVQEQTPVASTILDEHYDPLIAEKEFDELKLKCHDMLVADSHAIDLWMRSVVLDAFRKNEITLPILQSRLKTRLLDRITVRSELREIFTEAIREKFCSDLFEYQPIELPYNRTYISPLLFRAFRNECKSMFAPYGGGQYEIPTEYRDWIINNIFTFKMEDGEYPKRKSIRNQLRDLLINSLPAWCRFGKENTQKCMEKLFGEDKNECSIYSGHTERLYVPTPDEATSFERANKMMIAYMTQSPPPSAPDKPVVTPSTPLVTDITSTPMEEEDSPPIDLPIRPCNYMRTYEYAYPLSLSEMGYEKDEIMDLDGMELFDSPPDWTVTTEKLYPMIRVLSMRNNRLTDIPRDVGIHFPNLEVLLMDNNRITTIAKGHVWPNKLHYLSLVWNPIENIEDYLPHTLRTLLFRDNKFDAHKIAPFLPYQLEVFHYSITPGKELFVFEAHYVHITDFELKQLGTVEQYTKLRRFKSCLFDAANNKLVMEFHPMENDELGF